MNRSVTIASDRRPRQWGWALVNAVQLAFTALWSAAWISLALLVRLLTGSSDVPLRMAAHCWAPGLMLGAGARLQIEGLENVDWSRPHVLVANHHSTIDICALFRAAPVPLRFLLKRELGNVPFLGWYTGAVGMIPVARGSPREAREKLDRAVDRVRTGATLCAFPEGTRSRDGRVEKFKGGIFRVAIVAGAPLVPVAIEGSGTVLPPGGFRVRPGCIRVRFGRPIDPAETDTDHRALAERARDRVQELLE